jgi:hypothetical protein
MIRSIRALALAVILLVSSRVRAQASAPTSADTTALEFYGFRAGAPLAELDQLLRRLGGGPLRCDRAKADRRVTECRGVLSDPGLGGTVSVWVSAMDSVAGVITLSGGVAGDQLDRWRRRIERRYGRVSAQVQGPQWMMQWVRQGRMLRLTWRIEQGVKVASVSLVDGRVLDAWGRSRSAPAGPT